MVRYRYTVFCYNLIQCTDWITDELLHKIEANPKLARHLTNPRMAEALHKLQADQAAAMKHYESDAEVQEFFHEFCLVMGEHFSKLADTTKSKPNGTIFTLRTSYYIVNVF